MQVFLVRHGDFDIGDAHLNKNGRLQSERLAEKIKLAVGNEMCIVHSSTGPRSIETAKIIASSFNIEVVVDDVYSGKTNLEIFTNAQKVTEQISQLNCYKVIVSRGKYIKGLAQSLYPNKKITKPRKGGMIIYS